MAQHHYFEHQDRNGRTPADRVRATGYVEHRVGENIAHGALSTLDAIAGWLASRRARVMSACGAPSALARSWAETPIRRKASPSRTSVAPRAPSDPFFDQPYEPSAGDAEPAWERKVSAAPRGLSPNIKPKKRVAALFGAKQPDPVTN